MYIQFLPKKDCIYNLNKTLNNSILCLVSEINNLTMIICFQSYWKYHEVSKIWASSNAHHNVSFNPPDQTITSSVGELIMQTSKEWNKLNIVGEFLTKYYELPYCTFNPNCACEIGLSNYACVYIIWLYQYVHYEFMTGLTLQLHTQLHTHNVFFLPSYSIVLYNL